MSRRGKKYRFEIKEKTLPIKRWCDEHLTDKWWISYTSKNPNRLTGRFGWKNNRWLRPFGTPPVIFIKTKTDAAAYKLTWQ